MANRLTAAQVDDLATSLRSMLALIDSGDLTASTATVYRLQGALAALNAVRGTSTGDLLTALSPT